LRDDREDLGTTLLEHVEDSLNSEESIRVLLLTDTLEEDREVVMVVELLDFNLPVDTVLRSMLNGDWEISTIIEASEFRGWDEPLVKCTSLGLLGSWLFFGLVQADNLASKTLSFL
jgi:hypothetical protein